MKKSKLGFLLFTAFLSVYGIAGFARANCDAAAVYCIQATNTATNTLVKITFQGKQSFAVTKCFTNGTAVSVLASDIINQNSVFYTDGQTPNIFQFAQCKDKECSQSENLKTARFTLKQIGQASSPTSFITNPSTDSFKLDESSTITCTPALTKILFQDLK